MKKMIVKTLVTLISVMTMQVSQACTDVAVIAQDGTAMIARSMEFALDLKSNLRTSPRGRVFNQVAPDGKPALSWVTKYGYIYLDGDNYDAAVDGMNEAGLSFEALYLPGETQYQALTPQQTNHGIGYINLGDWILGNFKTVAEVRAALPTIVVYSELLSGLGTTVFPLHFSVYDPSGKGIVIEFIKGEMKVYDNTVGVLTNSPGFDWHVTNLRNYINLSPWTPNPIIVGNLAFMATGQGSGMRGLPGDISPPSRFVKMAVMKGATYPAKNKVEALNIAQHILNNVDIPAGYVRGKDKDQTVIETTEWVVFKDLTNKVFYYRTYNDTALHQVNLSEIDFSPNAARLKMPISSEQTIVDMTKQFLNSKS
jgi:choloylglycine hydrolase